MDPQDKADVKPRVPASSNEEVIPPGLPEPLPRADADVEAERKALLGNSKDIFANITGLTLSKEFQPEKLITFYKYLLNLQLILSERASVFLPTLSRCMDNAFRCHSLFVALPDHSRKVYVFEPCQLSGSESSFAQRLTGKLAQLISLHLKERWNRLIEGLPEEESSKNASDASYDLSNTMFSSTKKYYDMSVAFNASPYFSLDGLLFAILRAVFSGIGDQRTAVFQGASES